MTLPGTLSSLLGLVLLAGPSPEVTGPGTSPASATSRSVSGETRQEPLEEEALRFAGAWVDRSLGDLESMMVADGIRLHLEGELYPGVDLRKALAAIDGFLEKYAGGEVEVLRVSPSSGEESRGFTELQWRTRILGTGESVVFTVFVGFSLEAGAWKVTEIRILP
ncbi:MAG: hypothetical protein PVJ04_06665 [Gemmatimonadota bacterium]|jgi:hypothetical protein